jgi:hypothetical protein
VAGFFYFCSVKKFLAMSFICLFALQVGIKSLVAFYFHSFASSEVSDHCIYKTITVCKGSCYVAKQIKIVTSTPGSTENSSPGFDIQSFKDAVCISTITLEMIHTSVDATERPVVIFQDSYSYLFSSSLIKPPIA